MNNIDSIENHYLSFSGGASLSLPSRETSNNLFLLSPAFIDEIAEIDVIKYLQNIRFSGRSFVDIGAHIGFYAVALSPYFHRVLAFEPSPFQYQYLARNKDLNQLGKLEISNLAIGSCNAVDEEFFINGRSGGSNSFTRLPDSDPMYSMKVDTVAIDSLRLDDVGLLKIDVEGHELHVLEGATETIGRCQPAILCEVWDDKIMREKFSSLMQDLNYKFSFDFEAHPELAWCEPNR